MLRLEPLGEMPGTKIVVIGREPIDRAYSSYRYNYVHPATDLLKRGGVNHNIPRGKSDEYYAEHHLFTFEEMMRAELQVLKECFAPGGSGQVETEKMYGTKSWARAEFQRRKQNKLPPLIDLDETCYGDRVSKSVPRRQWQDLLEANPEKFVDLPQLVSITSLAWKEFVSISSGMVVFDISKRGNLLYLYRRDARLDWRANQ